MGGLSEVGIATLARSHADRPDWASFVRALHQETEGNPFFVKEILCNLPASPASGSRERPFVVPDGVRALLRSRLARLGAGAEEVLGWAAVAGRGFDLDLLVRCTDRAEGDLLDVLDAAVEARLVEEQGVGHYVFTHALVRSALYDGHSLTRRARMHARVARAIEEGPRPAGAATRELAYHYLASGDAAYLDLAIGYGREAAEHALAQLAYGEAADLLRRMVGAVRELHSQDAERLGPLLLELGDALARSGDWAAARAAYAEAAEAARASRTANMVGHGRPRVRRPVLAELRDRRRRGRRPAGGGARRGAGPHARATCAAPGAARHRPVLRPPA